MGDSSQAEAIRSSGDLTVNKKVGLELSPIDLSPTESTYDTSSPPLSVSRTEIMNENIAGIQEYLYLRIFHWKVPKTRNGQVLKFLIRIKVMNSSAQQTRFFIKMYLNDLIYLISTKVGSSRLPFTTFWMTTDQTVAFDFSTKIRYVWTKNLRMVSKNEPSTAPGRELCMMGTGEPQVTWNEFKFKFLNGWSMDPWSPDNPASQMKCFNNHIYIYKNLNQK